MNNLNTNLIARANKQNAKVNHINEGRIVHRYNISKALIECYFIPSDKLKDYEIEKAKQDLSVYSKYGIQIIMEFQKK